MDAIIKPILNTRDPVKENEMKNYIEKKFGKIAADNILPLPKPTVDQETKAIIAKKKEIYPQKKPKTFFSSFLTKHFLIQSVAYIVKEAATNNQHIFNPQPASRIVFLSPPNSESPGDF